MPFSRRDFLSSAAAAGSLPALLAVMVANPAMADVVTKAAQASPATIPDGNSGGPDSHDFWTNFMNPNAPEKEGTRGDDTDPRTVVYLHHSPTKGLRFASDIEPTELLDYDGDVAVSLNVGGFRFGGADRAQFGGMQGANLRVDMHQQFQFIDYLDTMAWMGMAAVASDKAGKLPELQSLNFDPASSTKLQKIVLPAGVGNVSLNVTMMKKESAMLGFLKVMVGEMTRFSPVLGLPAVSTPALAQFSQWFSTLDRKTPFLLKSSLQSAYGTHQARDASTSSFGMNAVSGDYVLIPSEHSKLIEPHMDKLVLKSGYLVLKDAPSGPVEEKALSAVPDVTYVSVNMKIAQYTASNSPTATGVLNGAAQSGSGAKSSSSSSSGSKSGSGTGSSGGTGTGSGTGKKP